jgi:hypothetical protein
MLASQASATRSLPTLKIWLRQPAYLAWLVAVIVLGQAMIRLSVTPYDPSLGEGDVEHLDAVFYLWKSAGVATVLAVLGFCLQSRRKVEHVA